MSRDAATSVTTEAASEVAVGVGETTVVYWLDGTGAARRPHSWRKTDAADRAEPRQWSPGDHNGASMATTVLIVDDHTAFRSRARRMLEADGFEVVGEAADGASGVDAARRLEPDVVLLDLQLPDTTGFAVAEQISGEAAVVITSTRDSADFDALARRSGARGFVSKAELSGAALEELLP